MTDNNDNKNGFYLYRSLSLLETRNTRNESVLKWKYSVVPGSIEKLIFLMNGIHVRKQENYSQRQSVGSFEHFCRWVYLALNCKFLIFTKARLLYLFGISIVLSSLYHLSYSWIGNKDTVESFWKKECYCCLFIWISN